MLGFVFVAAASAEEKEMTLQEALEAVETFEQKMEAVGGDDLVYDELGRVTPRKSIVGLAAAWRAGDFERAARYHDLSRLPADAPESMGAALAWQMRRILPQVYSTAALLDMTNSLGSSPEGRVDDGLPPQFERLARMPSRTGEAEFLLERVPPEDGERIVCCPPTPPPTMPTSTNG